MTAADEILDLTGLKCPLPALLTRRAVLRAPPGTVFEVLADDPLASIDLPHLCRTEGFTVVVEVREGPILRLLVRR